MLSSLLSCFLIVLGCGIGSTNLDNEIADKVMWESSTRLTYSDFKAPAPLLTPTVAATNFEISLDYLLRENQFHFTVHCNFVRNRSWMKPNGKNQHVLNHEQKHFDLAEAHARLLRKRLSEAHITIDNHNEVTNSIYDTVWNACLQAQKEYDASTHHSTKNLQQVDWNQKIADMLVELQDYAI